MISPRTFQTPTPPSNFDEKHLFILLPDLPLLSDLFFGRLAGDTKDDPKYFITQQIWVQDRVVLVAGVVRLLVKQQEIRQQLWQTKKR